MFQDFELWLPPYIHLFKGPLIASKKENIEILVETITIQKANWNILLIHEYNSICRAFKF